MLTVLTELPKEALYKAGAGAAALIVGFLGVLFAKRGAGKDPLELGMAKPEPDMTEYVLKETRGISEKLDRMEASIAHQFAEARAALHDNENRLEAIQRDTSILKDRR